MRTTVDLDQHVLRRCKQRAANEHTTLSRVIEEAVRRFLRQSEPTKTQAFTLITGGHPDGKAPTWEEIKEHMNSEEETKWRRVAEAPGMDDRAAP